MWAGGSKRHAGQRAWHEQRHDMRNSIGCVELQAVCHAVWLNLCFEEWEVRRESWTGPHAVSAKELGRVPGEAPGEHWPKVPKMVPKKEFCLLFSLSEIGSNPKAVFFKVSSQVEFHMAGTVYKARMVGFSPMSGGRGEGPGSCRPCSIAHTPQYPWCPQLTQVLLLLHQENCPGRVLVTEGPEPRVHELYLCPPLLLLTWCFLCPFHGLLLPQGSEKWRHEGCVNTVLENLRQCSRSDFWILEAWEP